VFAVLLVAVCGLTASTALIAWQKAETQQAYDLLAKEEKKAKDEEQKARAAYDAGAEQMQRAEDAAFKARQVLNSFTQATIDEIPDKPELRPIRRKLLEQALAYY